MSAPVAKCAKCGDVTMGRYWDDLWIGAFQQRDVWDFNCGCGHRWQRPWKPEDAK